MVSRFDSDSGYTEGHALDCDEFITAEFLDAFRVFLFSARFDSVRRFVYDLCFGFPQPEESADIHYMLPFIGDKSHVARLTCLRNSTEGKSARKRPFHTRPVGNRGVVPGNATQCS